MKPEVSTPQSGPEQPSVQYGESNEHARVEVAAESGVERATERHEQVSETGSPSFDNVGSPMIMPAPAIPVATNVVDDTAPSTNPVVAADDDVIEKEWVDKAKKIIIETRDDPFRREKAVAELQADYLRKRYGREPGAAN